MKEARERSRAPLPSPPSLPYSLSLSHCMRVHKHTYKPPPHHPHQSLKKLQTGSWAAGTEYISRLAPPGMKSTAQSLFSAAYAGVGAGAGALVSGSLYTSQGSEACFQGTAAAVVVAWLGLSALEAAVAGGEEGGTMEEEKEGKKAALFLGGGGGGSNGKGGGQGNNDSSQQPPLTARAPRPCSAIGPTEQQQQRYQQQYQQQQQRKMPSGSSGGGGGSPTRRLRPGSPLPPPPLRSPARAKRRAL